MKGQGQNQDIQDVIVVGGGASGLTAAVFAARKGAQVTILEHMDRVGKKILSTGNGRCNLTNMDMGPEKYRSNCPDFPMKVIQAFPVEKTLEFFRGLGLETKSRNGYIYPNSDQASTVLDLLRQEADHQGVKICCGCQIREIRKQSGRFRIDTSQGTFQAFCVILAAGSKAAPLTGSDGSGYELARSLGHKIIKPLPALVQLRCQGKHYRQLAGIRTEAQLSLLVDGKLEAKEQGELQLTDYGLSGIPVFQLSRYASRALDQGKKVRVEIDFLPSWPGEQAFARLKERARLLEYKEAGDFLLGLLNKKLSAVLLKAAGIGPETPVSSLTGKQLGHLLQELKSYQALVVNVNPFANAQVCCGGADVSQICCPSMESRCCRGLYLAGELLDVDGVCGGYNLQFAWSSGALAGIHSARAAMDLHRETGDKRL